MYLLLSLASTFAAIFLQRRCNCSALPSENPLLKKSKSSTWNKIFFKIPKITHIFQILKTNFSEQRCRSPPVLLRHKNHTHSIRQLTRIQSKTSPEGTNNHGFNDTKIYSAVVAGPNKTTNKGHTHTRDPRQRQTKHLRSQHGKPRTTASANPHLPKEDTRNRLNSQVPELCHTAH